jgi:Fic family protein
MKNKVKEFLRESNAIEGVYDTHSLKVAQSAWGYLFSQGELNDMVVKKTHYKLMTGHLPRNERGYYRLQPVWIGGKEAPDFGLIPNAMLEWFKNATTSVEVPGVKGIHIKLDHIQFERIHPFIDGNGRMGRILLNWQRVKAGLPILVIKESEKAKYYKWFK